MTSNPLSRSSPESRMRTRFTSKFHETGSRKTLGDWPEISKKRREGSWGGN